jgi:hypothetical protein
MLLAETLYEVPPAKDVETLCCALFAVTETAFVNVTPAAENVQT